MKDTSRDEKLSENYYFVILELEKKKEKNKIINFAIFGKIKVKTYVSSLLIELNKIKFSKYNYSKDNFHHSF